MHGVGAAALVVEGEASESDAEVEDLRESAANPPSKAFVIAGEAPESDEEAVSATPSTLEETRRERIGASSAAPAPRRSHPESLLHRKLWESNARLRACAESSLRSGAAAATARLALADKTLLAAQESLRGSNANLSLARARLKQISAALGQANCGAVLPTVRTR